MDSSLSPHGASDDAMRVADESHAWYRTHAIRTRRLYRTIECLQLCIAAGIPVAAAVAPHDAIVPAILGAVLVGLTGTRGIFHWQENYLRFCHAREAVERERRRYRLGASPYDGLETRQPLLVERISEIEQQEMEGWTKTVSERPPQRGIAE